MISLEESTISVDEGFTELQNLLRELKSLLGRVWTDDSLLALFFHQFNKTHFHHSANALDAKKSIDPLCFITAREIMQVAQRFQQQAEANSNSNLMALTAGRGRTNHLSWQSFLTQGSQQIDSSNRYWENAKPSRYPHPSMCPAAWATKWLSPEHPCTYCFQWGHWAMDCPRKSAGKPPIDDPKKKDPNSRYCKSEFVLHPELVGLETDDQGNANIASIGASTGDRKLVLIDSGATHHVAGSSKHPVVGIGTIKFCTPDGDLLLYEALHCKKVLHNNNVTMPYETVIKRRPSLALLQVFGCKAFIHNMTQKKDLTAKAKEVIHLGVAQDSQGWVFFDPATGGLVRSAAVTFKQDMFPQLKLRWDEEINSIMGIEVKRQGKGFILKQPGLIKKLVQGTDSHLTENQPLPNIKLESSPASQINSNYLSVIGMILYLAQATCPDIMYAVNYLARFAMNVQDDHWKALKHLVDHINTTKHQYLKIGAENTRKNVEVYVGANWGGEGSRSQHGFCILLHGTIVAWN
ncbi:hypothetical protein O181_024627 [Austropuccinia psidii MF-1]|uniref:Retroviral polymerase SH3-like domain-containing protein n=1 Tax=Austropuccinia psidii MF-1 TaxID=1389203 RepID=A0A9Q3CJN4_9BASI|nr:hypothetical protein [Austropuccinia psidii MF-1]